MNDDTCCIEGCMNPLKNKMRQLCRGHYLRWLRGKDLAPPIAVVVKRTTCSIPGCERKHYGRGLCSLHHQRQRKGRDMYSEVRSGPVREEFWSHVDIGAPNECWLWKLGTSDFGHGAFRVKDATKSSGTRIKRAHVQAWESVNGPLPEGLIVRHTCHVPQCCNPSHLRSGTKADNMQDMLDAGRGRRGEDTYNAVLTEAMVIQARLDARMPDFKVTAYAEARGINRTTMRDAIRGKRWKWLNEEFPPAPR